MAFQISPLTTLKSSIQNYKNEVQSELDSALPYKTITYNDTHNQCLSFSSASL